MADDESKARSRSTFRIHLLVACTSTTLALILVIAFSLFVPLATHLQSYDVSDPVSAGIAEHFLYLHSAFWPVALCSLASCVASALMLYSKMTKPLTRFVKCFEGIGRGEIPAAIVIRTTDYVSEEADSLNSMLERLRIRERERADFADKIDRITDQLLTCCREDADATELLVQLRNLKGLR